MEYRIIKKYYRNDNTAQVKEYYQVQKFVYVGGFFRARGLMLWKPCRRHVCYGMDSYNENANFDKYEDALEYMKSSMKEVPPDEVVNVNGKEVNQSI